MILQGQEHTLQRGGLMGERSYGIALSPKIYSMMSDKLYTDRIGSAVREVCSNAWDAQKMRSLAKGEPMQPFKVTLPTDLEPHFIVEDSGPGMPDEKAQDLFSTLGLSTKENTNDQIGAFGLGSKSPFAVSDTFTVENTYEGVTHYYLCFKSERGLPSLLKTGEKKEDRENGVKVIIPAPGYKYDDYKRALMKQLIVMEPKPVINNIETFEFIEPKRMMELPDVGYILGNATAFGLKGQTVYARMGMVLYPVDTYQVNLSLGIHSGFQHGATLVLDFPIGALEPLPSREGLTYDDVTIKNIQEQYGKFADDYKARLRKEVESCPTPLDAWRKIKQLAHSTSIDMMNDGIYVLGTPINDQTIPHVWPRFHYTWDEEQSRMDYTAQLKHYNENGYDPNDKNRPEPQVITTIVSREADLPVFVGEEYHRSDLRLNVKRVLVNFHNLSFYNLDKIEKGKVRYLLLDETEGKYRIPRLKSWLKQISHDNAFFIIRVDSRYKGSKTDFTEFVNSLERMHPGITKKPGMITYFSTVPRPEREKSERSEDEKAVYGLSILRENSRWERDFKWSELEDWVKGVADEESDEIDEDGNEILRKEIELDNIFYVTATRNDLNDYKGQETKLFVDFTREHDMNLIIVRKTGMAHIPRLESLGIKEFKGFVADRLKNFAPDDDYKSYNSAKILEKSKTTWFKWSNYAQIKTLTAHMAEEGIWVHPFLDYVKEVKRLVSSYTEPRTPELRLINALKSKHLFHHFKEEEWYKTMEIDISTRFNELEAEFENLYPALWILIDRRYEDSVDPLTVQYIKDYNTLNGKVSEIVDYTEVLDSQVI